MIQRPDPRIFELATAGAGFLPCQEGEKAFGAFFAVIKEPALAVPV
jgi:hypothetical protein